MVILKSIKLTIGDCSSREEVRLTHFLLGPVTYLLSERAGGLLSTGFSAENNSCGLREEAQGIVPTVSLGFPITSATVCFSLMTWKQAPLATTTTEFLPKTAA